MKIKIEVMLRDAILDPQGNTIKKSLNSLGFKNVKSVRQGKLIEIDLNLYFLLYHHVFYL